MSIRVFVPADSGALSVGADAVARALVTEAAARDLDIELVRNGSRGLYWLEPLVEVDSRAGRKDRRILETEMRAGGVDWRMNLYGGAAHSFTNPQAGAMGVPGIEYHELTDQRSWEAMLDLFHEVF